MIAALQTVRREWPKAERSAEFATRRASLPWVFPTDSTSYETRTRIIDLEEAQDGILWACEGHEFSWFDGTPSINLVMVDAYHVNDPRKVPLHRNQWIQIIRNFRDVYPHGGWFFGEIRLNIGVFAESSPDVFLCRSPKKVCDLRTHLNSRKPFASNRSNKASRTLDDRFQS